MANKNKKMLNLILVTSLVMMFFGFTGISFIPINPKRFFDLLILPAIIGAMIGSSANRSLIPAIAIGAVWSSIVVVGTEWLSIKALVSDLPHSTIFISRICATLFSAVAYDICRFWKPGCPDNVYRGVFVGVTIFTITGVLTRVWTGFYASNGIAINFQFYKNLIIQLYVPYLLVCMVMMKAWIGKLREVHLLNGVKEKNSIDYIERIYSFINRKFKTNLTRPNKEAELKKLQWDGVERRKQT